MKKYFTLILMAVLSISCSGSDDSGTTNSSDESVLLKHYEVYSNNNTLSSAWDLEYNGTKLTRRKASNSDLYEDYIYAGNQLTHIQRTKNNAINFYEIILEYNQNNKLTQYKMHDYEFNVMHRFPVDYLSENIFKDAWYTTDHGRPEELNGSIQKHTIENGNLIRTEFEGQTTEGETIHVRIEYEYDNKNSPYKNVEAFTTFQIMRTALYDKNNWIKITKYYDDQLGEISTAEYTYNDNGYPLTQKTFYEGALQGTIRYSYE